MAGTSFLSISDTFLIPHVKSPRWELTLGFTQRWFWGYRPFTLPEKHFLTFFCYLVTKTRNSGKRGVHFNRGYFWLPNRFKSLWSNLEPGRIWLPKEFIGENLDFISQWKLSRGAMSLTILTIGLLRSFLICRQRDLKFDRSFKCGDWLILDPKHRPVL